MCSLVAGYRALFSQRINRREIGETILDMFADGMRRSMAFASSGDHRQVIDIRYDDLVADPLAVIRRIYTKFGYRYDAAFEQDVARVVESQRAAARPRHSYTLEQFGLSRPQVIERSAEYLRWVQPRCGELAA